MRTLLLIACALVACKDTPKERAREAARAPDFWPDAPKVTSKTGTRLFRYQPANMKRYRMDATGGTPKGSMPTLEFAMVLELRMAAGKTPHERDVSIGLLDLRSSGVMAMKMRIDDKGMFIDANDGPPQTWTREEPGPFDIAAMLDTPFSTFVFEDDRRTRVRTIESHPFFALQMGDILDSGLVLFPELPEQAVAPGHRWKHTRNMGMGATGARADVTYEMTYAGDGACPSGRKSCAQIELVASSKDVAAKEITASYGFAGKIFFDTERGVIDESRVHLNLVGAAKPGSITLQATYVVKPLD